MKLKVFLIKSKSYIELILAMDDERDEALLFEILKITTYLSLRFSSAGLQLDGEGNMYVERLSTIICGTKFRSEGSDFVSEPFCFQTLVRSRGRS